MILFGRFDAFWVFVLRFGLGMPELRLLNAQENGAVTGWNQKAETLQGNSLALEGDSTGGCLSRRV